MKIAWSPTMNGISYSVNVRTTGRLYRFAILSTVRGFTVVDRKENDVCRTTTLVSARVWAGIRVGEKCLRRPGPFDREV